MKLTKQQLHDLEQLVKRKFCRKKDHACVKCVIGSCGDNQYEWSMSNFKTRPFTNIDEHELKKAKKLIKQHYMIVLEKILLEGST